MATKKRTKEKFSRYDTADYLNSEKEMAAYLEACMEEAGDDAAFIAHALGNIARAWHGATCKGHRTNARGFVQSVEQGQQPKLQHGA